MRYRNTSWDLKWINDIFIFVIAHSDDFCWFGFEDVTNGYDALITIFNKFKYTLMDCADKEFVGINIVENYIWV